MYATLLFPASLTPLRFWFSSNHATLLLSDVLVNEHLNFFLSLSSSFKCTSFLDSIHLFLVENVYLLITLFIVFNMYFFFSRHFIFAINSLYLSFILLIFISIVFLGPYIFFILFYLYTNLSSLFSAFLNFVYLFLSPFYFIYFYFLF